MTRLARAIGGSVAAWRPIAPFAALFVMLIVFAVGGMLVIAHEADRSDAARAREAVTRTFMAMLATLDAGVEMNVATSPVAETLSDALGTPASAYAFFPFTSRGAIGYHGTVVLNADGSAFAGTRFGRPWTGPGLAAAARLIAPVAARLPPHGAATASALRRDEHGEVEAIGVANAAPPGSVAAPDAPAVRRLAMIAPVATQLVPRILPSLGVEDFRIVAAGDRAAVGDNANAVTIAVDNGPPVVFAWRPRRPGLAAIARWAPVIGALLVAALAMLAFAARSNLAKTRALKQLAHHDSLTGLANRAAFRDELDRRQARGDAVVLGMIDLNGFKGVNDTFGHLVGDELLQAVATELARAAGPGDFVARLGGDEFAWLSPCRVAADRFAAAFAERIARPLPVGELRLQVGAAIGIAHAQPEMTASALMGLADARLYEHKHALRPRRRGGSSIAAVGAPRRRRQL